VIPFSHLDQLFSVERRLFAANNFSLGEKVEQFAQVERNVFRQRKNSVSFRGEVLEHGPQVLIVFIEHLLSDFEVFLFFSIFCFIFARKREQVMLE